MTAPKPTRPADEHIDAVARTTSTREWGAEAAEAEVATLRAKVAAVQALAEKRDVLYPPKWAFGAEENYCNGYRQARADFIAAMATGEGK